MNLFALNTDNKLPILPLIGAINHTDIVGLDTNYLKLDSSNGPITGDLSLNKGFTANALMGSNSVKIRGNGLDYVYRFDPSNNRQYFRGWCIFNENGDSDIIIRGKNRVGFAYRYVQASENHEFLGQNMYIKGLAAGGDVNVRIEAQTSGAAYIEMHSRSNRYYGLRYRQNGTYIWSLGNFGSGAANSFGLLDILDSSRPIMTALSNSRSVEWRAAQTFNVGNEDLDFTINKKTSGEAFKYDAGNKETQIGTVGTNYLSVEEDGTIKFVGNATVFRDELNDLLKTGKNNPSDKIVIDETEGSVYWKTTSGLNDYAYMNIQVNHDWKAGSDVEPHIHWWQSEDDTPNWLVQYRWQRECQSKTTAWTNLPWSTNLCSYVSGTINQITSFGTITPPANYGLSDILQIRIIRDTDNDSGEFDGADTYSTNAHATSFDVHVEIDTVGSRQIYTK